MPTTRPDASHYTAGRTALTLDQLRHSRNLLKLTLVTPLLTYQDTDNRGLISQHN